MKVYTEIEFVCWNESYPEGTTKEQQNTLFDILKHIPGVLAYMQHFDDVGEDQISLAAILIMREIFFIIYFTELLENFLAET